jgi:hypothetical protein
VLVLKAVDNGIAFDELYGVEEQVRRDGNEIPEVTYFAHHRPPGPVLYQRPGSRRRAGAT